MWKVWDGVDGVDGLEGRERGGSMDGDQTLGSIGIGVA